MTPLTHGLRPTLLSKSLLCISIGGAAFLYGCAPAVSQSHSRTSVRGTGQVVTSEDIARFGGRSAFDGIRLLRGLTTHSRDALGSPRTPTIYVDGTPTMGSGALRGILAEYVRSMEYLTPSQATMLLGPGHPAGVIVVRTGARRRGRGW